MIAMLLSAVFVTANDEHLKLHFDFTNVNGRYVTDNIGGIRAMLKNQAAVVDMGRYKVMDLGNGTGYLDMTFKAGALLRNIDEVSVSVCYRVAGDQSLSGNGYFLWSFAETTSLTETAGLYFGYRLNAQRAALSSAGWGGESGIEVGTAATRGRWMHMLYRQKGGKGELFINGHRVAYSISMPKISDVLVKSPAQCWIGRAPFDGDAYLTNTLVSDFRLYDVAVSDDVIHELSQEARELEHEFRYSSAGDMTGLNNLMQQCRDFIASPHEGVAPNILAELQDEINMVEMSLGETVPAQVVIDELQQALEAAYTKAKNAKNYKEKASFDYKSGQQGFVHPGALVTQADIDRAKKLIFEDKNDYMVRAWRILCDNQYAQANSASWPTTYVQRGLSGDNYMNAARGAAIAFQNALRWKISGDRAFADHAVETLMNWCNVTEAVTGNTNISLAAGLYGYGFANAAELMRDYDGWDRSEFERFKQWMVKVWYNPAIDFLRRRHDTWMNFHHPDRGERPGHYWSNWGLCNVLCVMSIGILCDDVHMYNQGVSFYKYDHQGTFQMDRSHLSMIINDGCNEFIGNLVPVVLPDSRGPLGYLGQMQESGRDQGHAVMALCCALDVCQIGFNQGDDLYAFMNDRIAAGCEYVCAQNYAGVAPTDLPWIIYEYADCAGARGASWQMPCADSRGVGERRPNWDRIRGYYEGLRGVKMQFADAAAATLCPDGGGGNYNMNSGGFDHLGFSSLTNYRPLISEADAITPLGGDIIYKGVVYKNQTNLGGLKYKYQHEASRAIPADGADITLVPQLPTGVEDTGLWQWNTGETTRQITVKADHSYFYRVTYTAANGAQSTAAFAIAVSGDAPADPMRQEITQEGVITRDDNIQVLMGSNLILYAEASTGWTDDYLWDNGKKSTITTVPNITTSRVYTCQFANQSGAVSNGRFHIDVVPALQSISVGGSEVNRDQAEAFYGSRVVCSLRIPEVVEPDNVVWHDGTRGTDYIISDIQQPTVCTATYLGKEYVFNVSVKETSMGYYDILTSEKGYTHIESFEQLTDALDNSYFILCSDEADLMLGLANAKNNGNKALHYQTPLDPLEDMTKVFTITAFDGGFCLRNADYDGLLLQTEMNAAWNLRTHDQPYDCSWARLFLTQDGSAWTVENGTYPGNFLGLWAPENGYYAGEETALNKQGEEIGHFQLFAIEKNRFHRDFLNEEKDATVLIQNPAFEGYSWALWKVTGTFGNQRFNGAAETWHSTNFSMQQTLTGLPAGNYTVSCQMANGDGANTGYLFATAAGKTVKAVVTQSCADSDFDSQRDKMAANASYALLSVDVAVDENGELSFGIKEPTNGTTWLVFDNFKLSFNGSDADGIRTLETGKQKKNNIIYDLSGRRVSESSTLSKGIYIVDGKKIVK